MPYKNACFILYKTKKQHQNYNKKRFELNAFKTLKNVCECSLREFRQGTAISTQRAVGSGICPVLPGPDTSPDPAALRCGSA